MRYPSPLYLLSLTLLATFVLLGSCKRPKDEPAPDPCAYFATPAAIRMGVRGPEWRPVWAAEGLSYFEIDDSVVTSDVVFSVSRLYDVYEWHIGTDPRIRYGAEVSVKFSQPHGKVQIMFVGHRAPQLDCNPKDTGKDTILDSIVVVSPIRNDTIGVYACDIYGGIYFEVENNYPNDDTGKYVMWFDYGRDPLSTNIPYCSQITIFNLLNGCGGEYYGPRPLPLEFSPYFRHFIIPQNAYGREELCQSVSAKGYITAARDSIYIQLYDNTMGEGIGPFHIWGRRID